MTWAAIFPSRMFHARDVEDGFVDERTAANNAGFSTFLVNQERLDEGSFGRATRTVIHEGPGLYRGWMMNPDHYAGMYAALESQGTALINSPEQYHHCHFLPESFDIVRGMSPFTVWTPANAGAVDVDQVIEAASVFGDSPVVIKDYVKSRKHEWEEACFVPSATNTDHLRKVVTTFVERQGDSLAGGVVVREYVQLESVGTHPKSGMPLTREHRIFVLDGKPLIAARYWTGASYSDDDVPVEEFSDVMKAVRSRFFTMDIARGTDGEWRIIELGDGQVAGLLDTIPAPELFRRLAVELLGGS